jgi:fructose-1,6-bisphosphatase/inositol monophosphatase family enzyme
VTDTGAGTTGATDTAALQHALLDLAVRLAVDASALLREGRTRHLVVDTKSSRTDMVTEVDRASEALIVAGLRAARPHDAIVGEEGTADTGTSGVRWLVDPIDGTTNYLYGYPAYAVSIAAEVAGQVVVGVVADASNGEVFTAVRGSGARRDGVALHVVDHAELATALVGTGFSYLADRRARQAQVLTSVLPVVRDVRRAGSAALDLCWVAAGRLDAFYEKGLGPWDLAAGALIATEAGARAGDLDGGAPSTQFVLAAAPSLFEPLRAALIAAGARDA